MNSLPPSPPQYIHHYDLPHDEEGAEVWRGGEGKDVHIALNQRPHITKITPINLKYSSGIAPGRGQVRGERQGRRARRWGETDGERVGSKEGKGVHSVLG